MTRYVRSHCFIQAVSFVSFTILASSSQSAAKPFFLQPPSVQCLQDNTCDTTKEKYAYIYAENAGIQDFTQNTVEIFNEREHLPNIFAKQSSQLHFNHLNLSSALNTPSSILNGPASLILLQQSSAINVAGNLDTTVTLTSHNKAMNAFDLETDSHIRVAGNFTLTINNPAQFSYHPILIRDHSSFSIDHKTSITMTGITDTTKNIMALSVSDASRFISNELEMTLSEINGVTANKSLIVVGKTVINSQAATPGFVEEKGNRVISANIGSRIYLGVSDPMSPDYLVNPFTDPNTVGVFIDEFAEIRAPRGIEIGFDGSTDPIFDSHTLIKGVLVTDSIAFTSADSQDHIWIDGGTVTGIIDTDNAYLDDNQPSSSNDSFKITAGTYQGTIFMGDGDDLVSLYGGKISGQILLQAGKDRAYISSSVDLSGLTRLSGGADGTPLNTGTLIIDGRKNFDLRSTSHSDIGLLVQNWNQIDLINQADVTWHGEHMLAITADDNPGQLKLTRNFSLNTLNIDNQSTLRHSPFTVAQTIHASVNNSGTMMLATPNFAGSRWTIRGDYTGNLGLIVFNTALGGDHSLTDRLIIEGDSYGKTYVKINNIGGRGALTNYGIKLIEVMGTSLGEFIQEGRIIVGPYDYQLRRGNALGQDTDNWYLTSYTPAIPTNPSIPTQPGSPYQPPIQYIPTYRPEVGSYMTLLLQSNTVFKHGFYDRQQMINNDYRSSWARLEFNRMSSMTAGNQIKNDSRQSLLHFGTDLFQQQNLHVGVMAAHSFTETDSRSHITGFTSSGESKGYLLGLYGTWLDHNENNEGFYMDSYAQYQWFKNKVRGQEQARVNFSTQGFALSMEGGYRFMLNKDAIKFGHNTVRWSLEPQIQLLYHRVSGRTFEEVNRTKISLQKEHNFSTRLGLRLQAENDEGLQYFLTLNYWHKVTPIAINIDDTKITSNNGSKLFEIKTGGQIPLADNLNIFGQIRGGFGTRSMRTYGIDIGLKYTW